MRPIDFSFNHLLLYLSTKETLYVSDEDRNQIAIYLRFEST